MSDVSKTNDELEKLALAAEDAAGGPPSAEQVDALIEYADALRDALEAATRVPVQGERELAAEALRDEFRSYLGDEIYVSSRDHSAWEHGTMGLDDFSLAAEDDEIVESLVQIASRATAPDAAFYGACGVELCETCLPLFDAANREIEGTGPVPDAATEALEAKLENAKAAAKLSHGFLEIEKEEHAETKAERDAALAAVERVRALCHETFAESFNGSLVVSDWQRYENSFPQELLAALDGAPEPEEKP